MKNDILNQVPLAEFESYGLVKEGKLNLSQDQISALKSGKMTDLVELNNLKQDGLEIESVKARLSIVSDGAVNRLRVDPVYIEPQSHPLLTEREKQQLISGEVYNVKKTYTDKQGDQKTEVIEYDSQTRQFMSVEPRNVRVPEKINGEDLTPEKKRRLKEGEVVTLSDGTEVQLRTTDKSGLRSNRAALVTSIIVDGGLSYLLISGIQKLAGAKSVEDKIYSSGYKDALIEVEKQLERKQAKYPNDPTISRDLNIVKHELSNAEVMSPGQLKDRKTIDAEDIENQMGVNDPDKGKKVENENPLNNYKTQEDEADESRSRGR